MQNVAVFWDYENCPVPSNGSGYALVNSIRIMAQKYGAIKSLRAYAAVAEQFSTAKGAVLRSELQCSGVSLVDCPHNGRKDVADKMMIVDMLAHAIDNTPSSTVIFLISGDRDFAYAMSTLRLRCYNLVLCAPNNAHASLLAQSSSCIDWASVAVLPGASLNFSKKVNEESQWSISQGPIPSISRSREGDDYDPSLDDVGVINPYLRRAAQHSDSFSLDARGYSADFRLTSQDYMQKSPVNPMKSDLRRNSLHSTHLSVQNNLMPDINLAGYAPPHVPLITEKAEGKERVLVSNHRPMETSDVDAIFPSETPLGVNASLEVIGISTSAGCATPQTDPSEPKISGDSSLMTYHLPVTTPLVVNEPSTLDSPSIQVESIDPSHSDLPSAIDATNNSTTPPAQEVPTLEVCISGDIPSSESGAPESMTSSTSAYITAASQSASASLEPLKQTPPPQFKALVQILQLHKSNAILKPTRSQIAEQLVQSANGLNPYKQAGVKKWAQYAELARKEGVIELGGTEGATWVALTPKWYDAHAT